jgi:hypothetical protein
MSLLAAISATAVLLVLAAWPAGSAAEPEPAAGSRPRLLAASVVRELPELRTEDSDTFLRSDGTRAIKLYTQPVNYRSGGNWTPIEDELVAASGGGWQEKATDVPVALPASLSSGPVSIGSVDGGVSFSVEGASSGESASASGVEARYAGVLPNVSAAFNVGAAEVRETLSLSNAAAPTAYRYRLSYGSTLSASLTAAGTVEFRDKAGKVIYGLAAPTVEDSAPDAAATTAPVHYSLSEEGTC